MITTVLQGPEYVYSAKRAGLYSHLLAYVSAVERGTELPPLPGEYAGYAPPGGANISGPARPPQQQQYSQQQVSVYGEQQHKTPIQMIAKKKASEKALSFFQSCLKVLSIEEEVALTDDILKKAYKKAVLRAHPDRGGTEEHFEAVTRAFAYLTDILHVIQGQKSRVDKPVQSLESVQEQRATQNAQVQHIEPVRLNPKNLNLNAFNQMFEQTRVPDPDEDGYGDWLTGKTPLQGGVGDSSKKTFGKEFNRDVFNRMFEAEAQREERNTQLALRQPEALVAMTGGIELGRERPPDYTAPLNAQTKFTDLKSAYTKENTFSGQVAGLQVDNRSFDSYKTQREKGPVKYNSEEAAAIAQWEQQQELREKQRQLRAAHEHTIANDYHERMKRLVIADK
jgi:curved DNA-binding protein CbpA